MFLTGTASIWFYNQVKCIYAPSNWEIFKSNFKTEYAQEEHVKLTHYKLRIKSQKSAVSIYLGKLRNLLRTIPNMSYGNKWDTF